MSDRPGTDLSPRAERFLRSVLPVGVFALVIWIAWLVIEFSLGDPEGGFSVVTAVISLTTSIVLMASGVAYRRALGRR